MRLHRPSDHLTRLALRQHTTQHEPAVLCQHTTIVEAQLGIFAADTNHAFRSVRGQDDAMTRLNRKWIHKAVGATIIIRLESLELTRFLAVGTRGRETGGISGQTSQTAIHREGLEPILRRQELQVEASIACQFLRHGLVEIDRNLHSLSLRCDHHPTVEVVIVIAHAHLNASRLTVHLSVGHLGHQVPLLRRVVQTHSTTLHSAHTMMDDFDARVLLVVETTIETVAEHQHVHALPLKVLAVVQL